MKFLAIRRIIKPVLSNLSPSTLQRLLPYSILTRDFKRLLTAETFIDKEDVWDKAVLAAGGGSAMVTYVEFGVHEGESILYFAKANTNVDSIFVGLDSFEGLPEAWVDLPKGHFGTGGALPKTDDTRVTFIKGWFQETREDLAETLRDRSNLLVHFDADLYSSTLFALAQIDNIGQDFVAVFDEFTGDELRALHDYLASHSRSVEFLAKTLFDSGYPFRVLCKISKKDPYPASAVDIEKLVVPGS